MSGSDGERCAPVTAKARNPNAGPGKGIKESGLFLKANSAMCGPGEGVHIRFLDRLTEHELEFMIVIGKQGSQIPEDKALDYVAGYCLSLDMTVRGGEERSSGRRESRSKKLRASIALLRRNSNTEP